MEKLVYTLWQGAQVSPDGFRDVLLEQLGPELARLPQVRAIRLAVADSAVAPAAARRMESHPPNPAALLSLWVDYAGEPAGREAILNRHVERWSGYRVLESEPLQSQYLHPSDPGERVYGMCQVAFLRKPAGLDKDEWLAIWQGSHTAVAIDTQSTFGYRQNLVVQTLGADTLPCDAIVEENFPPEAMQSEHAFYATGGDEEVLLQRTQQMLRSCGRFIDFEHIDVIPMSDYIIKPLVTP